MSQKLRLPERAHPRPRGASRPCSPWRPGPTSAASDPWKRETAARISTEIANTRRKLTLARSSSTGPAHACCAAGRGRAWYALVAVAPCDRAPSRVPTTTHLSNRIPSPSPVSPSHTSGTRREARRHARARAGRTSGGGCARASEGSSSRGGGEGRRAYGVPRFGSSRWRPSCRSHPSPASRGGGSVGVRALVRVCAHGVAWSRREGERERCGED